MPAWLKLLLAWLLVLLIALAWLASINNPALMVEKPIAIEPSEPEITSDEELSQIIAPILNDETFIFEDVLPDPIPQATVTKKKEDVAPVYKQHTNQQLALVIDDVGYDLHALKRLLALPFTLTVAILPDSPHAKAAAKMAHEHGITVMLHMPMQTTNPKYQQRMERFYLYKGMTKAKFTQVFEDALAKVPYVTGVNNHMGSLLTSDSQSMQWLMELCRKHKLFFVDSRTASTSVAAQEASQHGLAWNKRDVFLDHKTDLSSLQTAWSAALDCVKKKQQCIIIGHPHQETLNFLEQQTQSPELFVSVQNILK